MRNSEAVNQKDENFFLLRQKKVESKLQPSIAILKKITVKFPKNALKRSKNEDFKKKRKRVLLDNLQIHIGLKFKPDQVENLSPYIDVQTDDSQTDILPDEWIFFFMG